MANTSVRVEMDLRSNPAMSTLGNSENTSTNNSDFANINIIGTNYTKDNYDDFMTLEHNINILDGSLNHFKNDFTTGYFSTNLSSDACVSNNTINIDFSKCSSAPFNIPGLDLNFGTNNYMSEVSISYTESNGSITSQTFYPNKKDFKAILAGYNVNKIKIELKHTRFPRMFSRLHHIDYGFLYVWESTDVISCNVTEEISPISNVLPINIADVTLYSPDNEFNMLNPKGIYNFLDKGHQIKIKGIYNDNMIDIGTFYIDTWEGTKPYELSLHLISIIGVLEQYQSYLSGLYTYKLSELIQSIFSTVKQKFEYTISDELKDIELKKIYLEKGTVRSILQQILFTVNACADETRDGILKISRIQFSVITTLSPSEVIDTVNVSKIEQVTGIDITGYDYSIPEELYLDNLQWENLYEGRLFANIPILFNLKAPGLSARYKLQSEDSYSPIRISIGGRTKFAIQADSTNYYSIQVSYYLENKSLYQKRVKDLNPNIPDNILKVENNKLINSSNIEEFSNRLIDYYSINQLKIEGECFYDGTIKTGSVASIYTDYENYCQGFIVKQSIDLSGGFISKITMLGTHSNIKEYQYMTNGIDNLGNTDQYDLIANNNIQL